MTYFILCLNKNPDVFRCQNVQNSCFDTLQEKEAAYTSFVQGMSAKKYETTVLSQPRTTWHLLSEVPWLWAMGKVPALPQ